MPKFDPEHLQVLKEGPDAWSAWRREHARIEPQLSGADLRGLDLEGCTFERVQLAGANLEGLNLSRVSFKASDLRGANLSRIQAEQLVFHQSDLAGARLAHSRIQGTRFEQTNLNGADLNHASLAHACFVTCELNDASLANGDFTEARIEGCHFRRVRGAPSAMGLETTRLEAFEQDLPSLQFEPAELQWIDRRLSWERVRTMGNLPLLGISYFTLITLPLLFDFIDRYITSREALLASREALSLQMKGKLIRGNVQIPADSVDALLPLLSLPSDLLCLWVSSLCLAIAVSIYRLACPNRIQRFGREAWVHELRRPLIHYLPLAWKKPRLRVTSYVLFWIGFLLAAPYLLGRFASTWKLIWDHFAE